MYFAKFLNLLFLVSLPFQSYSLGREIDSNSSSYISDKKLDSHDKLIIHIIKKHSDLRKFGGFVEYHKAFDTILKEVNSLEFVEDAFFDFCAVKLLLYPGHSTLGVKYQIDGETIEKCYDIQVGYYESKRRVFGISIKNYGNLDQLIYLKNYVQQGFIDEQRELCNPIPKQEDLWKVKYEVAQNIEFRDTLNQFAIDSLTHDLGEISPGSFQIIKYFKYLGTEEIHLNNFNDDPHFITEFNQTTLVKDQVYQFSVIFHFSENLENFQSKMGFELSNGEKLPFMFTGKFKL
jgi:hypothetical protein